jgi:hypothetical protein
MQTFNFVQFINKQTANGIEPDIFKVFKIIPPINHKDGVWLAGGAIRRALLNEPLSSDVDLFFKDEASLAKYRAEITKASETNGFKIISEKENENNIQITIKTSDGRIIPIQLIKIRYYNTIEEILGSFDFTICQFGYDGVNLYCGDTALWDLGRKRILVNNITYPVASLRRLIKYTQQGFYACQGALNEFLLCVTENPEKLNNNSQYMD